MAQSKRPQEWQPKHLAAALDELRRHVNTCPVCRTWKPLYTRNPHCQNERLIVNKVLHLWSAVPAGSSHRQLAMFASFQETEGGEPAPF